MDNTALGILGGVITALIGLLVSQEKAHSAEREAARVALSEAIPKAVYDTLCAWSVEKDKVIKSLTTSLAVIVDRGLGK